MMQNEDGDKWASIRVPAKLLLQLEQLVETLRDEFGLPVYGSKSEAATEAIKQFLKKHMPKEAQA